MIYKMKLWQKIFVSSLIASILLFATCGIIVTVSGHKRNLQSEKADAFWMASKMKECILQADREHADIAGCLRNPLVSDRFYFQLYQGDTLIYDDFCMEPDEPRYDFGYEIKKEPLEIRYINNNQYAFIEEDIILGGENGRFILIEDFSNVYNRCNAQLQTLFLICGILSMVSAFIMLVTSLIITFPIKKINEAVKIVANNYYAHRLPIAGTDELNELSGNFNMMCEAIENNIKNYKFAIDNFVHEVKTPLTSIIGYAEMIQSYKCTDQCREEAVYYILMQARRLNSLVRKIMGFLIVESRQIEKELIKLDEVVEMACLSVKMQAEMEEIRIEYQKRPDVFMYGDKELLATLLVNLLDNAIKASKQQSWIEIQAVNRENMVESISVRDYGIGIPEEELDKLIEPFYTVDKSRSRAQNGVGLGLSICKSIIQAHDGKIKIESSPGKGTIVRLYFPFEEYLHLWQVQDELFEKVESSV